MKTKEIIKLIEDDGWVMARQRGSHIQFKHPTKKGAVTIPYHGNKDVPQWLESSILKQAGLK
ncbi:MAG: type II toxin-antitoxin system HicA family toxin [Bacteroidia bacterium]